MRFIILFMVIPIVILTATFNQYEKSKTEIKSVSFIADSNMTEEERERNLRNKGYVPKEASISPIIKPQLKKESKLVAGGKALISMTQYYLVYPDGLKIRIK